MDINAAKEEMLCSHKYLLSELLLVKVIGTCCVARWLRCLHCRLTARRSWVRFLHGALLTLGGRSSPDLQCSGGLSPGPFCVKFACSPRVCVCVCVCVCVS